MGERLINVRGRLFLLLAGIAGKTGREPGQKSHEVPVEGEEQGRVSRFTRAGGRWAALDERAL